MRHNIYSIFDTASGLYSQPFQRNADAEAVRAFGDLIADANSSPGAHPEDFSLHRIATFDDSTGDYNNEVNECLTTGLETVASQRTVNPAAHAALESQINGTGQNVPESL